MKKYLLILLFLHLIFCREKQSIPKYVLPVSGVNLRADPSESSKVLVAIQKDNVVKVIPEECIYSKNDDEDHCWIKSSYYDSESRIIIQGWIYSKYLGNELDQVERSGFWIGNKFKFKKASEKGILAILETSFLPNIETLSSFVSGEISFKNQSFDTKDGAFQYGKNIFIENATGSNNEHLTNRISVTGFFRNNKLDGKIVLYDHYDDSVDFYYNYKAIGIFNEGICESFEIAGILGHAMKYTKIKKLNLLKCDHEYMLELMWNTVK